MNKITILDLLKLVRSYNPKAVEDVKKAYEYAEEKHKNQTRKSGELYIIHPLNVAYILAEMHADEATLCAGLLHDVLEDTDASEEELKDLFGEEITMLVSGVTNIRDLDKNRQEFINERKIIESLTKDVRIIIIKLADRLHNMRTLQFKDRESQVKKSIETLEIYVPLAKRIGCYDIKRELEDLSFMYLEPELYKKTEASRDEVLKDNEYWINEMLKKVHRLLNDKKIPNDLKLAVMNIYGIYRKTREGKSIYSINDLVMIKAIVDTIDSCYVAMGAIHSLYLPKDEAFKDYISNPKDYIYRSIHTTVNVPDSDLLVKFLIRTSEMERISIYGLPAYWDRYRGKGIAEMQRQLNDSNLVGLFSDMSEEYPDDLEFILGLKKENFVGQIYVRTTRGNNIALPEGSTVIDFAYRIHSDVGNKMISAVVNGEVVELDYVLKDGDRVRIVTDDKSDGPNEEWLKKAITTTAKRMIKKALNKKKQ